MTSLSYEGTGARDQPPSVPKMRESKAWDDGAAKMQALLALREETFRERVTPESASDDERDLFHLPRQKMPFVGSW